MRFGNAVRDLRLRAGMTLRKAAEAAGFDQAYLSRVEAGRVPPSDRLIMSLASLYVCHPDDLFLLAGRVPEAVQRLVDRSPYEAAAALRNVAAMTVAEPGEPYGQPVLASHGQRAIEAGFPFEHLSEVAEAESWRKEVYRPVYHTHKWWAQRLGSVFRAAILGATAPSGSSIMDMFWQPVRLPGLVVFDPFMGSGTTIGEAHKLGCTAIGRDINPVAVRSVRTALSRVSETKLRDMFCEMDRTVGPTLRGLYRGTDSSGREADVLYFFWVKTAPCPTCRTVTRLYSTQMFARHTAARNNPLVHGSVHMVCPSCGDVFPGLVTEQTVRCPSCSVVFDPHSGAATRQTATCRSCKHEFPIAKTVKALGHPPGHELYAKLLLTVDGKKEYRRITQDDHQRFARVAEMHAIENPLVPRVEISEGFNTKQVLNYGYRMWSEFFNERQLYGLATLAKSIQGFPESPERDALATLFSGVLEFNNMFASYKGEGTGAVRHMFAHHILKPERMPIEANIWGTQKSSGAFSTLFESRLIRALKYKAAPFELAVDYDGHQKKGRKVLGVSPPMGATIRELMPREKPGPGDVCLSCGDSSDTGMESSSVDIVVTDPPFFDNVHYSELADFFFVWQELYFQVQSPAGCGTTRHRREVQDTDASRFSVKLQAVFSECLRVLKDEGLLVFSYHHSRHEGWTSVCDAVLGAGFSFVQAQPIKSEMSVAMPKTQASEPIDLDVLLVCRKRHRDHRERRSDTETLGLVEYAARSKIVRFNQVGRKLSRGDARLVVLSQLLVEASPGRTAKEIRAMLLEHHDHVEDMVRKIWSSQAQQARPSGLPACAPCMETDQTGLFDYINTL